MPRFCSSPVFGRGLAGCLPLLSSARAARHSSRGKGSTLLSLALLLCYGPCSLAAAQLKAGPRAQPHPGYLGVSLLDVDADAAARLHLKDTHGAQILTIDQDAPAASAGLRPRDVILELNGQRIENVDALRHRLHDTPTGSTVSLRIARDAGEQSLSVQLGDEAEIAQRAWEQHFNAPGMGPDDAGAANAGTLPSTQAAPASSFLPPSGSRGPGSSFLGVFSINAFYTGAEIDPLSSQLADFFGVHDGAGLLVRSVNDNSPAAAAGLKAGDVILRVNNRPVVSRVDWEKQLHANRGRAVQLAFMRNRHEQSTSLTAGKPRK